MNARAGFAVGLLLIGAMFVGGPTEARPSRVVSLNLCADQLLLQFADPGQIAAVTHLARDPELSMMAARAGSVPTTEGRAEDVIRHQPDLVLVGAFTARPTVQLLKRLGVRTAEVPIVTDLASASKVIRDVATLLGHEAAGEASAAAMTRRLEALPLASHPIRVVIYQASGVAVGGRTLASAILAAAGFLNMADEHGLPDGGYLPLERLVRQPPDILILETYREDLASLAQSFLAHPAIGRSVMADRRLVLPTRYWTCPGPWLAEAAENLLALRTTR